MVSKREQKKWRKLVQKQGIILDLQLTDLMIRELRFEGKARRKAMRMAKKRKVGYIQ